MRPRRSAPFSATRTNESERCARPTAMTVGAAVDSHLGDSMVASVDTKILVIGATSAIAQAVARRYASSGAKLFLVGRHPGKLEAVAADLRVRGATAVETLVADLDDRGRHEAIARAAFERLDGLDVALVAHGTLPDAKRCEQDAGFAVEALATNFVNVVALVTELANRFEVQGRGCLAVIGSVAGDRGRPSNYVYGSAKGGLALYLQGLRGRLVHRGVTVLTIKPGFVDTPMTAAVPKNFLFASPDRVATLIERAISGRRDIVYVPGFWRWIMLVIRSIPETVFKRLRL